MSSLASWRKLKGASDNGLAHQLSSMSLVNGASAQHSAASTTPSGGPSMTLPKGLRTVKEDLPITKSKDHLIDMIKKHQTLIVVGETGSGKSTQLPQYLKEAGCGVTGKIGCTEPRRIAAVSLATRVAQETGTELGDMVGYKIRFDNKTHATTVITYMTDGTLLYEMANDPRIYNYSAIMLDEAHERNLNTDILFGLLKAAAKKRPELKIIVTSATLDAEKFSNYFDNAPICRIPGSMHPVEVIHRGYLGSDYEVECTRTVLEIHRSQPPGDILVFLCGEDKIERCYDELIAKSRNLWVLRLFAQLPMEEQNKVFDSTPPECTRKVVLATNIAETSLTIPGIVYVVDGGVAKVCTYDPSTGMKELKAQPISKEQATQRKGRAGRTQPGVVYRLYSESKYQSMKDNAVPEIQRSNLENAMLLLAAYGVEDLYKFDFIDSPRQEMIEESIRELKYLEALDTAGRLTQLGRTISKFPLDPRLAKVLITSSDLGCTKDVLTIVSLLSVQASAGKVFNDTKRDRPSANRVKGEFYSAQGDYHTMLNAYNAYVKNFKSESWCRSKYVNYQAMVEAEEIRTLLEDTARQQNLTVQTCFVKTENAREKAFLSGYFSKIAHRFTKYEFETYSASRYKQKVFMNPGSALFKNPPVWVLYEELTKSTGKTYMRNVVSVEKDWIKTYAKAFKRDFDRRFPPSVISKAIRGRMGYDSDEDLYSFDPYDDYYY